MTSPEAPGSRETAGDGFEPVDVFADSKEMDLRPGADACYKCSTCDTTCPVAEVDDDFPGPKFQGPEQWRLKQRTDVDIDPSVMKCSNCMRCDDVCPASVPLSQMHNTARAAYVDEHIGVSREAIRNRLLSNYGRIARIATKAPRLANAILGSRLVGWLNKTIFGITNQRDFPAFAPESFSEWWRARGGARIESTEQRVAYFHGDYANYNTPSVARALVRVFEAFGYEVVVPDQRCSGTPMFANGHLDDARQAARFNISTLSEYIADGYDVVCSCTSCSMALRKEYPELFSFDGTATVAANTYEAIEYLRIHEDLEDRVQQAAGDDTNAVDEGEFVYHAPCHARNQGLARQAVELFEPASGIRVTDVGDSCSGISGTYGWKSENYETSMAIGEEMFAEMHEAPGETGLTECPTCAMQMEHGSGYPVQHPLELLESMLT